MTDEERPVVITGCGLLAPLGDSPAAVFDALCRGQSATSLEAGFDTTGIANRVVGVVPREADLLAGLRKDQSRYVRKNTKVMCRDTLLVVGSSGRAVGDAGLALGDAAGPVLPAIDHARLGVMYGAAHIPPELDELGPTVAASVDERGDISLEKWGRDGIPLMFPLWLLKFLPNMLSCHVGIIWDCQGPSNAITCNEASGLLAVGEAFRHVARGAADIMFSGGGESKINPSALLRQRLLGNASTHYADRPESAHRPFDAARDGCVCAEGAATVILESADHASRRGARPQARLAGFGSSCATTLPNEAEVSGAAIARAIRAALRDADLQPADIDAVVAHGAAVPAQDVAEARAIRQTLGDVPVTSFAGGMGNVGAAHGPIDLALACRMLHENKAPPIRNCDQLDAECPINAVLGAVLDKPLNRVMVLTAAIAGQSAALVLEKA